MYDAHLVRKLCVDVLNETDPDKVEELLALLQAVVREDHKEVRIRMAFLTRRFGHLFTDSMAAD